MYNTILMSNDLEAVIAFMDFYHEQLLLIPEKAASDSKRAEIYGSLKTLDTINDFIDDLRRLQKNLNS